MSASVGNPDVWNRVKAVRKETSQKKLSGRALWNLPVPQFPYSSIIWGKGMTFQIITLLNSTKKMTDIQDACMSAFYFIIYPQCN